MWVTVFLNVRLTKNYWGLVWIAYSMSYLGKLTQTEYFPPNWWFLIQSHTLSPKSSIWLFEKKSWNTVNNIWSYGLIPHDTNFEIGKHFDKKKPLPQNSSQVTGLSLEKSRAPSSTHVSFSKARTLLSIIQVKFNKSQFFSNLQLAFWHNHVVTTTVWSWITFHCCTIKERMISSHLKYRIYEELNRPGFILQYILRLDNLSTLHLSANFSPSKRVGCNIRYCPKESFRRVTNSQSSIFFHNRFKFPWASRLRVWFQVFD